MVGAPAPATALSVTPSVSATATSTSTAKRTPTVANSTLSHERGTNPRQLVIHAQLVEELIKLAIANGTYDDPQIRAGLAQAFAEAGLGPGDLALAEVQDTDAARELLAYEELGLCERGGAGELLDSGATGPRGRLPVNVSGGLLSKGEPLGASALGQVVEVTRQLQGRSGARQVEGARVGLTHTVGRGANASVCILTT